MPDANDTTLRRIALRSEDSTYYALTEFRFNTQVDRRMIVTGDGKPLALVRGIWYRSDSPVDVLEIAQPDRFELTGWKLPDGVTVHGAPEGTITDEERTDLKDSRPAAYDLYERSGHNVPVDPIAIPAAEWTWLEGEAPPDDARVALWRPNLPSWLEYGREFSHVFPGTLVGFRTAMLEVVEGLVDGSVYLERSGFKCFANYKYSPPRFHESRRTPRSRAVTTRETNALKEIFVMCVEEISGPNLAGALDNWDAAQRTLEGDVRRQACVKICSACGGKGVITKGSP